MSFATRQRNVPPPVYNSRRLKELPIPITAIQNQDDDEATNDCTDTLEQEHSNQNDQLISPSSVILSDNSDEFSEFGGHDEANSLNTNNEKTNECTDTLANVDANQNDQGVLPFSANDLADSAEFRGGPNIGETNHTNTDEEVMISQIEEIVNEFDPLSTNYDAIIKTESTVIHARNADEIEQLLNQSQEIFEEDVYDDDIVFFVPRTGFPQPPTEMVCLVKRESDEMSGDVPYNDTVSND